MSTPVQLDLPDEVVGSMDERERSQLAREALLVRRYDLGQVSSGLAAQMLGVSRRQFLDTLGRYGVTAFDDEMDAQREAQLG